MCGKAHLVGVASKVVMKITKQSFVFKICGILLYYQMLLKLIETENKIFQLTSRSDYANLQ